MDGERRRHAEQGPGGLSFAGIGPGGSFSPAPTTYRRPPGGFPPAARPPGALEDSDGTAASWV